MMEVITNNRLNEVVVITNTVHKDERGFFMETYVDCLFNGDVTGVVTPFVQDNVSFSAKRGTLRGLHFQNPHGQGKLITVLKGEIFDVVVDVRLGSTTRGEWTAVSLSEGSGRQLWIPPGFAHGFLTLTDDVLFSYKCTDYYSPENEHCIAWNDPAIGICWPSADPILSEADAAAPTLSLIDQRLLPRHHSYRRGI